MLVKNVPNLYINIFKQAELSFPEIKGLEISFISKNLKSATFQTQPRISTLLNKNKRYLIIKSSNRYMEEIFNKLSTKAQIGIIVHELCHVLDFEKMTFWELLLFAVKYPLNKSFKKKVEQNVDLMAYKKAPEYLLAWKNSKKYFDLSKKHNRCYWENQEKYYLNKNIVNKSTS